MGCLASSPNIINVWCGTSVLLLVVQTPCFAMFNIILSLRRQCQFSMAFRLSSQRLVVHGRMVTNPSPVNWRNRVDLTEPCALTNFLLKSMAVDWLYCLETGCGIRGCIIPRFEMVCKSIVYCSACNWLLNMRVVSPSLFPAIFLSHFLVVFSSPKYTSGFVLTEAVTTKI